MRSLIQCGLVVSAVGAFAAGLGAQQVSKEAPRELPRQKLHDATILLTPYVVEGGPGKLPPYFDERVRGVHWRYLAMPGVEILSACPPTTTANFAQEIFRQQAWLDELVAPELQEQQSAPTALILISPKLREMLSQEVMGLARSTAPLGTASAEFMPQLKLWDEDSTGAVLLLDRIDASWDPSYSHYGDVQFSPGYVFQVLASRNPPLPAWFVIGVLGLYRTRMQSPPPAVTGVANDIQYFAAVPWLSATVEEDLNTPRYQSIFPTRWRTPQFLPPPGPHVIPRPNVPVRAAMLTMPDLLLNPAPAPASAEAKEAWLSAVTSGAAPPAGVPLDFYRTACLVSSAAEMGSPWRRDLWNDQATLFVRWALADGTHARMRSLWKFAYRASEEPATEAMFKDCFGFGFEEAARELDAYLPKAADIRRPFGDVDNAGWVYGGSPGVLAVKPDNPIQCPYLEASDATEAQEARLLGDWERKEIDFVRLSYPAAAIRYAKEAEGTLQRAYDDRCRDPELLASLGLCECALGKDEEAYGYLSDAVEAHVARPQAYVELARLRLAASLAAPAGKAGRIDRAQAAGVLKLLQATRLLEPPQLAAYLLAAETWAHADFIPSAADLRWLDEGLHFFPEDLRLPITTAELYDAAGLRHDAVQVVDRAMARITDPETRKLLEELRNQYPEPAGAN